MNGKYKSIVLTVMLVGVLCVAGCTKHEDKVHESWKTPEPKAQVDDNTLADTLRSAVRADPEVKNADVKIEAHNGEFMLSGTVNSQAQMDRVMMLAWMAEGVQKVHNKMSLSGAAAPTAK
ncbi:BON domain-containing protein [Nitrosovibrio tenuis]|uniref:Hyperosmotically inducible protein n=1 Tax=Nitrosovibrio tenuis TaxID=1233 RepID=A0A1H7P2B4_9PROT|nr:BON domain-containing protein [Nitrosovibrio tenuis]SEL29729.1 hyperosmotically inducible protein [Nitrosovibrio tenuis]